MLRSMSHLITEQIAARNKANTDVAEIFIEEIAEITKETKKLKKLSEEELRLQDLHSRYNMLHVSLPKAVYLQADNQIDILPLLVDILQDLPDIFDSVTYLSKLQYLIETVTSKECIPAGYGGYAHALFIPEDILVANNPNSNISKFLTALIQLVQKPRSYAAIIKNGVIFKTKLERDLYFITDYYLAPDHKFLPQGKVTLAMIPDDLWIPVVQRAGVPINKLLV